MARTFLLIAVSLPLCACGASVQRAVYTTGAATDMQQVTRSRENELDPAISPDAKTIAYEVTDSVDRPPRVEAVDLKEAVAGRAARVEYSSRKEMGMEPAWLPDGSRLVFVSDALGFHKLVETIGPSVSETRLLGNVGDPLFVGAWPAISPRGTMAMTLGQVDLFKSGWRTERRLDSALALSDFVGSEVKVVGEGTDPAFSPDGSRIAFSRTAGGHAHLFVMNADGSGAQQITYGSDDDVEPTWSPDGTTLAFCSARGDGARWTQANLFSVRADGSWLVQLTEGDRVAGRPNWARDGFIYFHANATDRFHIWRLRPVGGRPSDAALRQALTADARTP